MQAAARKPPARPSRALLSLLFINLLLIALAVAHGVNARLHASRPRAQGLRRLTRLPLPLPPAAPLPAHSIFTPTCQASEDIAPLPNASAPLVDISVSSEFSARSRRDAIRAGYALQARALGFRVRFFVGEAAESDVQDRWRKQSGSAAEGDIAAQLAHERLARESEQRQFGDLVILPMADTYGNLTTKTLAMAVHTSVCGRGDFMVKTDDDVFIFAWRLAKRLQKVRTDASMYKRGLGVYMGTFWVNAPPITATDSKNFEPMWGWKGKFYTAFAGGPFYIVSRPAINFLARNARRMNRHWRNEDMAMSTWMQGLDVEAVDEERIKILHWKWSHPPYIALHNIDEREDIEGWHARQAALHSGPDSEEGA